MILSGRYKLVFSVDTFLLKKEGELVSTDGALALLVSCVGNAHLVEDDSLVPCFNMDEMKQRNEKTHIRFSRSGVQP